MSEPYVVLRNDRVTRGVEKFTEVVSDAINQINPSIRGCDLSQLHSVVSIEKLNSLRMGVFKELNSVPGEYDQLLEDIAGVHLREILGPDLLVQTKLNFSVQMPGDKYSQLDLHSDCWAGDTPFELNVWIPLTKCFSSNSMFLLSELKSIQCLQQINENPMIERDYLSSLVDETDFLRLEKGEVIAFNPGLIHGNVVNNTSSTRVSINVRFKNAFSPDAAEDQISRSAGPYYRPFSISEFTQLALRLRKVNMKASRTSSSIAHTTGSE